jgi:hypothetical protein
MKKAMFVMFVVLVAAMFVIPAFAKTTVSQSQQGSVSQTQVGKGLNVQGYSASGCQGYNVNTCKPKANAFGYQNTDMGAGQINIGNQNQKGNYKNTQGVTIK